MSETRAIKLTHAYALTGLAILITALIVGVIYGRNQPNPPVIITGGSLESGSSGWSCNSNCSVPDSAVWVSPALPNGDSNVFSSNKYKPALQNVPANQGWAIHFTVKKSDGSEDSSQGVWLCDNAACNPGASPDPGNSIYLKLVDASDSVWDSASTSSVKYFHKKNDNCDVGDTAHHGGKCDYPYNAVLATGSATNTTTHKCAGSNCWIGVGTPK